MANLDTNIFAQLSQIVEQARSTAYRTVNSILVQRNWLIGRCINQLVLDGNKAEYSKSVIKDLSLKLTDKYGVGFDERNLYWYAQFNSYFPVNEEDVILNSVSSKFDYRLSWTHYRTLLQVADKEARTWYEQEAASEQWSVRTLQRNISSQYYFRMLSTHKKELVHNEMVEKTKELQTDKHDFFKNPVIAEFLGFTHNADYTESDLEKAIITHMEKFLLEMGKGFAFVARQKHIHTEKEDYYIDLVFYNYKLRCFVLVDLKTEKIRHQDVGQMDMYVRMYDELIKEPGDNPTIGLLLCGDTDDDIARYSVLKGSEQLFAAKYLPLLPSPEELRREIEEQKAIFLLTQKEKL